MLSLPSTFSFDRSERSLRGCRIGQSRKIEDGPDFDGALPGSGNPRGDPDRLVEILGLDEEESAQLLAGLGKRAIGHPALALADADARRGRHGMKRRSPLAAPRGTELVAEPGRFGEAALPLALGPAPLVAVDQQHVFHDSSCAAPSGGPPFLPPD